MCNLFLTILLLFPESTKMDKNIVCKELPMEHLVVIIAAMVELYSKHGLDTITVPIAASLVLSIASFLTA